MGSGSDMYRQQILDHYRSPRNYGNLDNASVSHVGENPLCGDEIQISLKITDDEGVIKDIRFTGEGCAISQAAASLLTVELTGQPVSKLVEMDRESMGELLGIEVSPMRVKCAVLAEKVAQDAYRIYTGEKTPAQATTTEE